MELKLIISVSLIFIALLFWIFDFERYVKTPRFLDNRKYFFILVMGVFLGLISFKFGDIKHNLLLFLVVGFVFFSLIFLFNLQRRYIYIGALVTLVLMPIFYFLRLLNISENLAILFFILLLIGICKDVFYDKIYK